VAETIVIAIATIAAALGGAWFGYILSHRAYESVHLTERLERDQDRTREREELRRSVRTLINLEIEHNLAELRTFWHDKMMPLAVGTPIEQQFQQRRGLIDIPLPYWQHRRWESLTTELPAALTLDELRDVQDTHSRLDALTDRAARIAASMPAQLEDHYDDYRAHTPSQEQAIERTDYYGPIQTFVRVTQSLWSECEELYRKLDNSKTMQVS